MSEMDGYERLAEAVVLFAVKDYRTALKKLKRNPKNLKAKEMADDVERFFRSDTYRIYTSVDGEMLIRRLREEAGL